MKCYIPNTYQKKYFYNQNIFYLAVDYLESRQIVFLLSTFRFRLEFMNFQDWFDFQWCLRENINAIRYNVKGVISKKFCLTLFTYWSLYIKKRLCTCLADSCIRHNVKYSITTFNAIRYLRGPAFSSGNSKKSQKGPENIVIVEVIFLPHSGLSLHFRFIIIQEQPPDNHT